MDRWQTEFIAENLPSLLETIVCDIYLISYLLKYEVLTKSDDEKMEAIGKTSGQSEKTKYMLSILQTKNNGYRFLVKSLLKCRQSGAVDTLLKGIKIHAASTAVLFQGEKLPLEEVCKSINDTEWKNIIRNNVNNTNYEQFLTDEPLTISINTIPNPLPYYIPRTLSTNRQIDPKAFEDLPNDIFCIEGLELFQMSKLTRTGNDDTSDRSTNQIYDLTARFILLEHHDHFQDITIKTEKLVHWIKHDQGNYFYIKSSNRVGFTRISEFFMIKNSLTLSEDKFVDRCLKAPRGAPVLLYDSPGMGKSVLLAAVARKIKEKKHHTHIIYVSVTELVAKVREDQGHDAWATVKQFLLNLLTTNIIGRDITQHLLDSKDHDIELFLDGFDEVHVIDIPIADNILKCIVNQCPNIRMFITTRPHRRKELEEKFGVVGYHILPFDDSNKTSFFTKYWEIEHGIEMSDNIIPYAERLVQNISNQMSNEDRDIAGIPLQCKMLADIFVGDASKGLIPSLPHIQLNSIFKVFEEYIKTKFVSLSSKDMLYQFHLEEALRVLFPHQCMIMPDLDLDYDTVYKIGILEPCKSDSKRPIFVHRTFAEFIVAHYLVTSATAKIPLKVSIILTTFTDLFFEHALNADNYAQFHHPVMTRFINFLLSCKQSERKISGHLKNLLRKSVYHYTPQKLFNFLKAALIIDGIHLFQCVLDAYLDFSDSNTYSINLLADNHSIIHEESENPAKVELVNALRERDDLKYLVTIATKYSSLELLKMSCKFLHHMTRKQFHEFEYGETPLRASLERGHFQIFEYLLKFDNDSSYSPYDKPLLYYCMYRSAEDSPQIISDKVQILKMILDKNPILLEKKYSLYDYVPLLYRSVHFELIKCLIQSGADLSSRNQYDENVAHLSAHFSAEEYHQFVALIISRNAKELFKQRQCEGETPVHIALRQIDLKTETLQLLANECSINFNDNSTYWGKSELAIVIERGGSERLINDIVGLGGDHKKLYKRRSLRIV